MNEVDEAAQESAAEQAHIFKKGLPLRMMLHEVLRALGSVDGQNCLAIGSENGMLSSLLRQHGGKWQDVTVQRDGAEAIRSVVGGDVHVLADTLPFKKKTFDAVVIFNALERVQPDYALIGECHRVLKPDGRLIVVARRLKSWSLLTPLDHLFGSGTDAGARGRDGYTESELFGILKNGFNVLHVRSYSRFFLQLVDLFTRGAVRRRKQYVTEEERDCRGIYSIAGPFYRIADQVDLLLFMTRGFQLIASAKRRAWRPRDAPVLVDGRSISEAVLSKPSV